MSADDLRLLDELADVLSPPPSLALEPSAAELEAFAVIVAAHFPESVAASPRGAVVPLRRPRRVRSVVRTGGLATDIVLFSASAAAAATGRTTGVLPLPRPVRAVAHAIGLPVDSPALDDAHHDLGTLRKAVRAGDTGRVRHALTALRQDVSRLPDDELRQAQPEVQKAVTAATAVLAPEPAPAPAATPSDPDPASTPISTAPPSTSGGDSAPAKPVTANDTTTSAPAPATPDSTPAAGASATGDPSSTTTTTAPATTTTSEADPAATPSGDPAAEPGSSDPSAAPAEDPSSTTTTTAPPSNDPAGAPTDQGPGDTTTTTSPAGGETTPTTSPGPSS